MIVFPENLVVVWSGVIWAQLTMLLSPPREYALRRAVQPHVVLSLERHRGRRSHPTSLEDTDDLRARSRKRIYVTFVYENASLKH